MPQNEILDTPLVGQCTG